MPSRKKTIYLDYAASTPVDRRVLAAMEPYFSEQFGNPGSLHSFGQASITAVDSSREAIAESIGAEFREVVFTSSATEANNLALRGAIKGFKIQDLGFRNTNNVKPKIIVSTIEHESILETARDLERDGVEVVYISVEKRGVVDLRRLKDALDERTVLVSIMHANNEIGTIQSIFEIARIIYDFRNGKWQMANGKFQKDDNSQLPIASSVYPLFHTDSAQAFQFLDCNVQEMGVDMMTLSSHKLYGPKGAGALYLRSSGFGNRVSGIGNKTEFLNHGSRFLNHSLLASLTAGGGQEFGLRSGTENVPAIVGFAAAVELRNHLLIQTNKQMAGLRTGLWRGIRKIYPKAVLNVAITKDQLPNILNVYFPGYLAQDLLTKFDLDGLAVSSGSACRSRAMESSYVIEAIGHSKARAKSSIRFSLGRPTTKKDIDGALKIIKTAIKKFPPKKLS